MYKNELDLYLQDKLPKAIFLYGHQFYIDYYSSMISKKILKDSKPSVFYFSDYKFKDVFDALSISDLFSSENLVILKLNNTIPKNQILPLLNTLQINSNSYLIVEFHISSSINESEYAKKAKLLSQLFTPSKSLKDCFSVRFYPPKENEAIGLLSQKAKSLELNISLPNLSYLYSLQGFDISLSMNELEKFAPYKDVSKELIDELSYGLFSLKVDLLIEALFSKKGSIIKMLEVLHDEGIEEMSYLKEISQYFLNLFKIFSYIKTYGALDPIKALGFNPPKQVLSELANKSIRLDEQKYKSIFRYLNCWRVDKLNGRSNTSIIYSIKIQEIL